MKHNFPRRMAVGALSAGAVAGLIVMVPGAAFAAPTGATTTTAGSTANGSTATPVSNPRCTPATFSQAQQLVEAALSGRVTQLNALASAGQQHRQPPDAAVTARPCRTTSPPWSSRASRRCSPRRSRPRRAPALRTVAHDMVFTYRVYVVMTPQTHLTIVTDDETYIEGVFVNLEPQIATAIANAQAAGKNVTAAQAAFNDLKNQVTSAQGETAGQSAQILAQTPSGYPGNWQVFLAARTNATNAHSDLHAAYADAQQIRTDLQ